MDERDKELRGLRIDLAHHSQAAKFTTQANKAAIEDLKSTVSEQEKRIRHSEDRIRELEKNDALQEERIKDLKEAKREHTGKIETLTVKDAKDLAGTETKKAKFGLYGAVVVAIVSGIASLVVQLVKMVMGG